MAKRKAVQIKSTSSQIKRWHAGPLKGSFMALAIVGFLITIYIVSPRSYNFGIALSLVFIAMFIASVISMTQAPVMEK